MQAVLISIRPEWCSKIVNGEKAIEVRKTKPKLEPPFKCYIYMTKGFASYAVANEMWAHNNGGMCVIAEFVCDRIFPIHVFKNGTIQNWNCENMRDSCVSYDKMASYVGRGKTGYGWHISDLKVYDTPKALSEFKPWSRECKFEHLGLAIPKCQNCHACQVERAPQSWCYVEQES